MRTDWSPEIWSFSPAIREVGVEDLTIEFPNEHYRGHHLEAGYHAILFLNVHNGWVRNVTITDCDRGVTFYQGSAFCTATNVTLKAIHRKPLADGATGHYGFCMGGVGAQDNLIERSRIETTFVHNMAVQNFANGNVYSKIESESGRFDHHGAAPYENLYTEIVLTRTAADLFSCGGNRAHEPSAGARNTFWNIIATGRGFPSRIRELANGRPKFCQLNAVGVGRWREQKTQDSYWVEQPADGKTNPTNLYEAQLRRRLSR